MAYEKLFSGNPQFPIQEPEYVAGGASTNDTSIMYVIDTGGVDAVLSAGMQSIDKDGTKGASVWASKTFNGVMYGRWTNVGADVQLAVYQQYLINSAS